jgi:hypothetical protein
MNQAVPAENDIRARQRIARDVGNEKPAGQLAACHTPLIGLDQRRNDVDAGVVEIEPDAADPARQIVDLASRSIASLRADPEPIAGAGRYRLMRIREENRNIFLLAAVTLCCGAVAGTFTLFEPVLGQAREKPVAETAAIDVTARTPVQTSVRVVGAPFEPNVNPRER